MLLLEPTPNILYYVEIQKSEIRIIYKIYKNPWLPQANKINFAIRPNSWFLILIFLCKQEIEILIECIFIVIELRNDQFSFEFVASTWFFWSNSILEKFYWPSTNSMLIPKCSANFYWILNTQTYISCYPFITSFFFRLYNLKTWIVKCSKVCSRVNSILAKDTIFSFLVNTIQMCML